MVVNGTPVGGETPGGVGNEVLESETPAGIRAWVCGRTTPGGLGMEICGWACADLILGVRDPWGAGLGGPRALVGVPGGPASLCLPLGRGGSPGAGWKAPSGLGVGERWTGRATGWVRPGPASRVR